MSMWESSGLAVGIQSWMAPARLGTSAQSYPCPTGVLWALLQSVASPARMQILLPLYLCGCYRTAAGARPVTFFLEVLLAFLPSDDRSVQAVLA